MVFPLCDREQDEGLDDLSASLTHVGHVGVSIHEELSLQVHPFHCRTCISVVVFYFYDWARWFHCTPDILESKSSERLMKLGGHLSA